MQIKLVSVMVDDQDRAFRFYTTILGFEPCADIPMGPYRWLTLSSPDGVFGVELVLEPMSFPPARVYQQALYEAEIPATSFITDDIQKEYARLRSLGVTFMSEPKNLGPVTVATFDDTCGNLISLAQPNRR